MTSSTDSDPAPESTEGDRLGALKYVANRVSAAVACAGVGSYRATSRLARMGLTLAASTVSLTTLTSSPDGTRVVLLAVHGVPPLQAPERLEIGGAPRAEVWGLLVESRRRTRGCWRKRDRRNWGPGLAI